MLLLGGADGSQKELLAQALAVVTRASISVAVLHGFAVSPHVGT
jgi:hypothetical protein